MYSLGCRLSGSYLSRAAIGASVEPHVTVDGQGLPAEFGEMFGSLDVLEEG